jgi:hypothetical protein
VTANQSLTPVIVSSLIATALVVIGFGNQPYGYYMLLRLFLCGVSLFIVAGANRQLPDWQRWTLGGFSVLYNPIIPVQIGDRGIWEILNVVTIGLFWIVVIAESKSRAAQPASRLPEVDMAKVTEDLTYAKAFMASRKAGGTMEDAHAAATKAIGKRSVAIALQNDSHASDV